MNMLCNERATSEDIAESEQKRASGIFAFSVPLAGSDPFCNERRDSCSDRLDPASDRLESCMDRVDTGNM